MPGPKPTYTERLQILLDVPLREALDAYTVETHTKAAPVIRAALRAYLGANGVEPGKAPVELEQVEKSLTGRPFGPVPKGKK